jgi:hypothetical protein
MWTDGKLDERYDGIDRRFDDLERRMDAGFARVDCDLREVRTEIRDIRQLMFMLWGPTMLGVFGMIATVIITNT